MALFGEGLAHPFFHQVIQGAVSELDISGHNAIISVVDSIGDFHQSTFFKKMHERRLEGLLVMGISETDPAVKVLLENKVPTVLIDAPVMGERIAYVQSDNYRGTYMATEHLLSLGHRSITFVNEKQHSAIFKERSRGFRDAMEAWGIYCTDDRIIFANDKVEDGITAAKAGVSMGSTAIMTFSDRLALGVIEGLRTIGLRIPDDISVIGFDDITLAEYASPPLTTVRQHGCEMGRLAVRELVNASGLTGRDVITLRRHIIDTQLIIRNSTGPAKKTQHGLNQ